jgi:[acyl-carrier-protein] S-malonyltransferase
MPAARPVLVFPGQGSQSAGMGRDWYEASPVARRVLDEAASAAGFDLLALCFQGPEDRLALTEFQQPCTLAVSTAVWSALAETTGARPFAALGHSLGEYSAWTAAGSLATADAVRLVRRRGAWMQEALPEGKGGMAALLGATADEARAICAEAGGEVWVANLNGGGQVVISGRNADLERAVAVAKSRGVRRVVSLPVSAPFHCPLMAPAAERLAEALSGTMFAPPAFPVIANVDAEPRATAADVVDALTRQVTSPVLFEDGVRKAVAMGADLFVEFGPGAKVGAMVKRIAPDVETVSLIAPADLDGVAARINH